MLSAARSPSWTARTIALGQHRPAVGADPRDVDEVRDARVRPRLADEGRHEVQVVVLDEERRAGQGVELLHRGRGQRAVRRDVAVGPGGAQVGRRVALELPEPVLDEPEHRVRHHAVVRRVHLGCELDQVQPEGGLPEPLLARAAGGDLAVALPERGRDPGDVVTVDERPQGGDEAASAPHRAELALHAPEADRSAVRDDHERLGHVSPPSRSRPADRRDGRRPSPCVRRGAP